MNKYIDFSKKIAYVGVEERKTDIFEGIWPIPEGVSYNSYIINDEKTALIDTVEEPYAEELMSNIKKVIGEKAIDYLIINHMEPDHSSSILKITAEYPNIQIVGNVNTFRMLEGYYGIHSNLLEVKDGSVIELGNSSLKFFLTPMVHWPETMMTYMDSEKTLFSGDAFGSFKSVNGNVSDHCREFEEYKDEMIRYYSNIVGKYGIPVQRAIKKLSGTDIKRICPTHGPVWEKYMNETLQLYSDMSQYKTEKGVVIAYASMYGNTAKAAMALKDELLKKGEKYVVMHNLNRSHFSYALRDIFRYDTLIIASPTYNGGLFPMTELLVNAIQMREVKNHKFATLGSCTWAGTSVKRLLAFAETMGWSVLEGSVEFKQGYSDNKCNLTTLVESIINR